MISLVWIKERQPTEAGDKQMVKATPKPTSVFALVKSASADSSESAIYAVRRFKTAAALLR